MLAPAASLMIAYVAYPLATIVWTSVMSFQGLLGPGQWVGLDNFRTVISTDLFVPSLLRSFYYTAANVTIDTAAGFGIAMLLNAGYFGRSVARGAILFPFIVPATVVALMFSYLFSSVVGLANYALIAAHIIREPLGWLASPTSAMNTVVLISVWRFLPFVIILFLARLQTINRELIEAARSDGANDLQVLRHVVIPWMMPTIVVVMILRTIGSFNEYETPYLLTQGGPLNSTLVLPIVIRMLLFENQDPGSAAAVAVLMVGIIAVAMVIYLLLYRRSESILYG